LHATDCEVLLIKLNSTLRNAVGIQQKTKDKNITNLENMRCGVSIYVNFDHDSIVIDKKKGIQLTYKIS